MNFMSNPAEPTAYDILYKGMSEDDRERIQVEITEILAKSVEKSKDMLAAEVAKAVEHLQHNLVVNPWVEWVNENGNAYEFLSALRESIWKMMLDTSPTKSSKWTIRELIEAWRKSFPGELEQLVGAEVAAEITKLKEDLKREREFNRRH